MSQAFLAAFLSIVASIHAINRPVFKIVLTQKGYAQFLQYDIETSPIREFTFCTWIRVYDTVNDQSIFTYVANGNKNILRLWLDTGGHSMKISINGKFTSTLHVDVVKDVWRHICLSYQSNFGAWALYIDSRLINCEVTQSLYGFMLPSGGSVIIGYGTADDGIPNGLEGEIFGANMILLSTIEKNNTMKSEPQYKQNQNPPNKLRKFYKNMNYVVLGDLMTDEIQNNFEKAPAQALFKNSSNSYISINTPHSHVQHNVGANVITKLPRTKELKKIVNDPISDFKSNNMGSNDFGNYDIGKTSRLPHFDGQGLPVVFQYETPPPPPSIYFDTTFAMGVQPTPTDIIYKTKNDSSRSSKTIYRKHPPVELPDYETPPPEEKSTKVYGQWTSSKFAGTVLNYLKSINFKNREHMIRKVPQTIPLYKTSDSHPYPSDFRLNIIRPPTNLFKNRKLIEKRFDIFKRDPQINVKIIEDDLRSRILRMHAETQPENVEITNRGVSKREQRHYRNVRYGTKIDEEPDQDDLHFPRPFSRTANNHVHISQSTPTKLRATVFPFLRSLEYHVQDSKNTETQIVENSKDMYSKSFSQANKWHNVKSYSNDYTPRKINMDSGEANNDRKIQYPSIRLKYVQEKKKNVEENENPSLINGRKLAVEIINGQSHVSPDAVSILKYNNGNLPTKFETTKMNDRENSPRKRGLSQRNMESFDQQVKIGNALNERKVIGNNEKQKQQSFVGGNDSVPDINRYRSDIDNVKTYVPPSLGPKVCKNVELYDRVLYVQQDQSIDMTHILSPVKEKNIAIEFIVQNYKKCSLTDSAFHKNTLVLIDWSKTPVRLFGGSYPKTTTDLCGFF